MPAGLQYESCSERVGEVLGRDVMKTVAPLIPDLLAAYPLLLFQGGRALGSVLLAAGSLTPIQACRRGVGSLWATFSLAGQLCQGGRAEPPQTA